MKYLNVFKIFAFVILIFLHFSCSAGIENIAESESNIKIDKLEIHSEKEVNYLIYMAADNNLERFGIKNIKSLQEIGSSKNVNIIVLFDRSPGYDKSEDNRTGTDLFYITKNPKNTNDDIVFEYDELDMTAPKTLYDFLMLVNKYFPAKNTILNVWSHGRGVYPDGIILQKSNESCCARGLIEDYTTGYGAAKTMSIYDFAECLRSYETNSEKTIDVIQFDCCDMLMLEVCYELKNITKYVVGSECEIPAIGCDYKNIANYLYNCTNFNAFEFSNFLVENFYNYYCKLKYDFSYAALKTEKFEDFINYFNLFCEELLENIRVDFSIFNDVRNLLLTTDSAYSEFIDFWEFLNSEVFSSYSFVNNLKDEFNELILNYKFSENLKNNFGGIGLNFPHTEDEFQYYLFSSYDLNESKILSFYNNTKWKDFLRSFLDAIRTNNN